MKQTKPFAVTLTRKFRESLIAQTQKDGQPRGVFFDTSGKARVEIVNPTAQYEYIYQTDAPCGNPEPALTRDNSAVRRDHSPGPWRIGDKGESAPNTSTILDATGLKVCSVESFPFQTTGKADARLIQAAPQLLSALRNAYAGHVKVMHATQGMHVSLLG